MKIGLKGKRKVGADAPIQAAVAHGELEGVKACLGTPDFSIDQKNEQQESVLVCAILQEQHEIFQTLL